MFLWEFYHDKIFLFISGFGADGRFHLVFIRGKRGRNSGGANRKCNNSKSGADSKPAIDQRAVDYFRRGQFTT